MRLLPSATSSTAVDDAAPSRRYAAGPRNALVLAGTLTATGALHLAVPRVFDRIVPPGLGSPRFWTLVSGVAELACAAGLASRGARRGAGLATAALLVGVFPANLRMTQLALRDPSASPAYRVGSVLRLPVQVPLVLWALAVARGTGGPAAPARQRVEAVRRP